MCGLVQGFSFKAVGVRVSVFCVLALWGDPSGDGEVGDGVL